MIFRVSILSVLILSGLGFVYGGDQVGIDEKGVFRKLPAAVPSAGLPNLIRITPNIWSGGDPGEVGFSELSKIGVATIISVDSAEPNVLAARQVGMRYVHLPQGYDRIPMPRVLELAKALSSLDGPFYIHCHHGRHRSPASAAAACVVLGRLSPEQAKTVLAIAETDAGYRGLFETVEDAKPVSEAKLAALKVEFRESVQAEPVAEMMVKMSRTWERLEAAHSLHWRPTRSQSAESTSTDSQSSESLPHEALMLREQLAELHRFSSANRAAGEYLELIRRSERQAKSLQDGLGKLKENPENGQVRSAVNRSFQRVEANCKACHQRYRD